MCTCAHAYKFYQKLRAEQHLNVLLMDGVHPREVFANTYEKKLLENSDTFTLAETKCKEGHLFRPLILRSSRALFNIMAKNVVAVANDNIHASKKRGTSDKYNEKCSSDRRNISKLSSF